MIIPMSYLSMLGRYATTLLSYITAAIVCVILSVPSGNNSPVWIPTGVALAAVLRWGPTMLWPIAIGSLAVNTFLIAQHTRLDIFTVGSAAGITIGNLLTIASAYWLIKFDNRAFTHRVLSDVHKYIVVTAVCGWWSALVGTAILMLTGLISLEQLPRVATLWWLSDFLAMLLISPLIGIWASRQTWQAISGSFLRFLFFVSLAICGSWLVFSLGSPGNWVPFWVPFTMLAIVLWTAIRVGPSGSTLVSFIIAVSAVSATLFGYGPFAARDQYYSLLTLGMYIALIIITGLIVTNSTGYRYQKNPSKSPGRWSIVTLVICLTITVGVSQLIATYAEQRVQEQFRGTVDTAWKQMDYRMGNYRRMLLAGKAYFDSSSMVDVKEWKKYVSGLELSTTQPGTLGMGYAQWLGSEQLYQQVENELKRERNGWRMYPELVSLPAAIVTFIEPKNVQNTRALGYNMMSNAVRRAALIVAAKTGTISSTSTVALVQETNRNKPLGFLMFAPVYSADQDTLKTENDRMSALRGFIFSPFRIVDMVNAMVEQNGLLSVRIFDLHTAGQGQEIFSDSERERAKPSRYIRPLMLERNLKIDQTGHNWRVVFSATSAFEAGIDKTSPLLALGLGAIISFLLFDIVRGMAMTRSRALEIAQEITRELQIQQSTVKETEERFRLFTSSVHSHAIIYLDANGLVEAWNEGATNLLGYVSAETIGRPLAVWADPEEGSNILHKARASGSASGVAQFVRKKGTRFVGEIQTFIVRRNSEITGFSFIVRDITATQELEAHLRRAVELAEEASRAKGAFVANMSHELRTPMNGVLGLAAVLERSPLNNDQRDVVKMIRRSGETLLTVINDILNFSKIEAGKVELELAPTLIDDLAFACARQMTIAGGQGLRMLVDVSPTIPTAINTDAIRLEQVLTNLIGNALKFTKNGAVECRFLAGPLVNGREMLQINVKDTGIGMSPEQQKRLFSPFTQADVSTTRRFGGTGLGLTIARGFADLLGGSLTVASKEGEGSTFSLLVPMLIAEIDDKYMLPPDHCKLSVMIYEPDPNVAASIANATARWGWHLHFVRNIDDIKISMEFPSCVPYSLIIAGAQISSKNIAEIYSMASNQLQSAFTLIRIVAGLDAPELPPIPSASMLTLHSPVTRASLYNAVLQVRGNFDSHQIVATTPNLECAELPLQGLRVLLAEDNAINQVVATAMLEYFGASVDIANNGIEAISLLRDKPELYDVILMDVQMPGMDGLTASRTIRNDLTHSVPIIAMTAGVTEDERRACSAAGMQEFISKPIEEDELVKTLRKYVDS